MKNSAQWRLTAIACLVLAPVSRAGVLSWPVTVLKNWSNPAGPDFQPYFLSNDGNRMVFLWASGPLVVPLNELTSDQYGGRLAMNPPTVNPFFPVVAAGASPGDANGGSSGSLPGTTATQLFLPPAVPPKPPLFHPPANPVPGSTPPILLPNPGPDTGAGSPAPPPPSIPPALLPPASPQIASNALAVPEPGTAVPVFAGLLAAWIARRRRRQCDIA
jgi:hypothetical protein